MKNYELDTKSLPIVWVTWMTKDGRIWMDCDGNRQHHAERWMRYDSEDDIARSSRQRDWRCPYGSQWSTRNNDRLWVAAGSQLYYAYAKYHKDIDRLEFAAVRYDTTRKEGKHGWMYDGDRFFIGKDKSIIDQNGVPRYSAFNVNKRNTNVECAKDMVGAILRLTCKDFIVDEFKKLIGNNYFIIGNGTSVDIKDPWHISKWFNSKQKVRSTGKSQKLVDELVQYPLGYVGDLAYKYPPKYMSNETVVNNVLYYERVNDDWSVLRAFIREDDGGLDEAWRVYLGEDGTNRFVTKSNGDWVPSSQHRGWHFSRAYYFANEEEAKEKCNRIKYTMPITNGRDMDVLLTTLRFPIIEQLYKMGYLEFALNIARSGTPKAEIKAMFGDYYAEKEKSVLRQLGMTKYQLDEFNALRRDKHCYGSILKIMRETLGEDLSRVDNATYNKYLNAFDAMVGHLWSVKQFDTINTNKSAFWKNVARLHGKNNYACNLVNDTVNMYNRLNVKPEIDWIFDDYSDVVRAHDALSALYNEQEAERRTQWDLKLAEQRKKEDEYRKKVDKERKHYEYDDENFIIRLPESVHEIIREGSIQSICIGGYTTRHSKGETNLFFLRRKDDESTPFYAIEMNKNKTIVQIHGSCNKWLGNNPEAIPTVVRWLRKHNIKCDSKILTCTAKGYGRTNEYIPMPQVD